MPAPAQLSDEALFSRLQQEGDMAAFDVIYGRYERRLFGFLRGYLRTRADVEEVFHDTFIQVLKSREVRFERGSFAAWIFKIARNLALNRARSSRRADAFTARWEATPPAPGAEETLVANQQAQALAQAVAGLPQQLAEVFHLRAGGMSYEEIAFTLGIPLGTVKSRTHEMVARLKTGVVTWTDA
ncbi:MAG TPA: sigma-70 family RNA polymerase sigma factor [Polyangia bacterium]